MAKRKAFRKARRARVAPRSFRRARRSGSSSGANVMGIAIGGMAYGAGREYVSQKLAPLTAKIPAGELADEVGMGILSWALATGKIPVINKYSVTKDIGRAGLAIESARVGSYLGANMLPGMKQNAGSASSYVLG